MLMRLIDDVFIDFIGDDERIVFLSEFGNELQFLAGEDFAGGLDGLQRMSALTPVANARCSSSRSNSNPEDRAAQKTGSAPESMASAPVVFGKTERRQSPDRRDCRPSSSPLSSPRLLPQVTTIWASGPGQAPSSGSAYGPEPCEKRGAPR